MAHAEDSLKPFHLFGNLFLEDPDMYLEENRLAELKTLQPHLDKLAARQRGTST
jgi:hypothetical protein